MKYRWGSGSVTEDMEAPAALGRPSSNSPAGLPALIVLGLTALAVLEIETGAISNWHGANVQVRTIRCGEAKLGPDTRRLTRLTISNHSQDYSSAHVHGTRARQTKITMAAPSMNKHVGVAAIATAIKNTTAALARCDQSWPQVPWTHGRPDLYMHQPVTLVDVVW